MILSFAKDPHHYRNQSRTPLSCSFLLIPFTAPPLSRLFGNSLVRFFTLALILLAYTGCTVAGPKWHRPVSTNDNLYREYGIASWYGDDFHEKPTASGEIYDMYGISAAHKTLPLGIWVTVTDIHTNRTIRVRINDRGPFVKGRIIDLSIGAAKALGMYETGTAKVVISCPYSETTLTEDLGYWVQLGAYSDPVLARETAASLRKQGFRVEILLSGLIHRVRIGPFSSSRKAYRTRDRFRNRGTNAYVIRDLLPLAPPPEKSKDDPIGKIAEAHAMEREISQ